ncbi:transcription initiation factor TFIID subunit 9-like [Saccoglossus kowalevskii]|uniref:Transcription initiation factor TFIID subunit 9-like n=1 Tax=Saccoglossus kowalevskii TaxID=10224 RepID=A0ABM0GWL8_SACKO|nr:PREDICTED: transcription initiation factor TFIID subunit 9-like [Saccoglossus kowalevskii]
MAATNTTTTPAKSSPRDAQVMAAILKDMGVSDYEPRLINQMLEFTFRYVSNILDDAKVYSQHAGKKTVDTDDVRLSIQHQMDHTFTSPPPKDLLMEIARERNSAPLPLIKPHNGLRLPPDRYCLSAVNYRLKHLHKKHTLTIPKLNIGPGTTTLGKPLPTLNLVTKPSTPMSITTNRITTPSGISIVTKSSPAITMVTTQGMSHLMKPTLATPNTTLQPTSVMSTPASKPSTVGTPFTVRIMPTTSMAPTVPAHTVITTGLKRKREDEDQK